MVREYFRIQQNQEKQNKGELLERIFDLRRTKLIMKSTLNGRNKILEMKYIGCFFDYIWCRYCEMGKKRLAKSWQ